MAFVLGMGSDVPRVRPLEEAKRPPDRKPPPLVLAATAAAVIVAGVWLFQAGGEPANVISPTSSSRSDDTSRLTSTTGSPSLLPDTPWTLIFDDGLDGVVVLDPNDPVGHESKVEGQRPGDQPYRLEFVERRLIVGWEEIFAVDIDSRESTLLGEATIFVPAAEPGRVWLIDYSGGRIGQGALEAWQVSSTGEVLTPPAEIETNGIPAIGTPAGLAMESDAGLLIWDVRELEVVGTLGSGASFVSDSTFGHGGALAWCSDPCDQLHITELPSMADQLVSHPGQGTGFIARAGRFSGDGRYLAAPTESGDVVITDRDTGRTHLAFSLLISESIDLEWAPSGYELFARSVLDDGLTSQIAYHRLGTGRAEIINVSVSMGPSFVVVNEDDARSFLAASTD